MTPTKPISAQDAARVLYMEFCRQTMGNRMILSWEELPKLVQDAWVVVLNNARKIVLEEDETKMYDVRSDDGEFVTEIALIPNAWGFPPRTIVVDGNICDRKKFGDTHVYYMRPPNGKKNRRN